MSPLHHIILRSYRVNRMAENTKYKDVTQSYEDDEVPILTYHPGSTRKRWMLIGVVGLLLLIAVIASVVLSLNRNYFTYIKARIYESGAVASDSEICSKVGADILKKNGNAIDSAVATIFCLGVVNLHSCGIGGGGFMVAYIRAKRQHVIYDYREEAPSSASEDMYVNSTKSSTLGGTAVAVPGEVKGLWAIHQKYGQMKWSELIEPSINIAENGFSITVTVDRAIETIRSGKYKAVDMGLRKLFSDGKGGLLKLGDKLRNPALARTLRNIQKHNATDFYEGELAKRIVKDIKDAKGDISLQDLQNYKVRISDGITLRLPNNLTLTAMSAPGGGPIVTTIMNIMSGYDYSKTDLSDGNDLVDLYQTLIEAMKYSYAQRGYLGDPSFLPKSNISKVLKGATDRNHGNKIRKKISLNETYKPSYYGGTWASEGNHGTAHLSIVSPNGDAVAATSTINTYFGSMVYSEDTGIIYNNEMDDFSTPGQFNVFNYPPSPANFIRPGKRPLSSMSPVIVTDPKGDVRMICGASGGSRIITGTAQVLIKKLFLNQELGEAVDSYRIHHQGIPNVLLYSTQPSIRPPGRLLDALKKIGHVLESRPRGMSVVQAIYYDGKKIHAKSDSRKGGKSAGF